MAGDFKHDVSLSHYSKDKPAVLNLKRSHKGLDENKLQSGILW